jgi:hypothetical protein
MTKKFLIHLLILTSLLGISSVVSAAELPPTKVIVSERIPGVECRCIYGNATANDDQWVPLLNAVSADPWACSSSVPVQKRKYECTVEGGLAGFQWILASIVRWFVYIVMLLGVLSLVGLGIAWSLAGGDDAKAKSSLKKWAVNILVGMIILFFFRYILQFLAPWIYQ